MKVIVDGVEKELEYVVNDTIDISADVIGINEILDYNDKGVPIMTREQYKWWSIEINKLIEIDELTEELHIEDDTEVYNSFIFETEENDLESQTCAQVKWLKDYKGYYVRIQ